MALPILDIHRSQSGISDDQEVLTICILCGERPVIRTSDEDLAIEDHDFVVCPFMFIIEGDCDSRSHEDRDGRDRGVMRLSVGVQDDVYLYTPLMGTHKRPRQLRRMEEIRLHQDGVLGASDAIEDRLSCTAVGAEIDRPRGFPWAMASRSVRLTEAPM
jgi:hypothetical protein